MVGIRGGYVIRLKSPSLNLKKFSSVKKYQDQKMKNKRGSSKSSPAKRLLTKISVAGRNSQKLSARMKTPNRIINNG